MGTPGRRRSARAVRPRTFTGRRFPATRLVPASPRPSSLAASGTLAPILADLEIAPSSLDAGGNVLLDAAGSAPERLGALLDAAWPRLAPHGWLLLVVPGAPDERELAAWRNAAWPRLHLVAWFETGPAGTRRHLLAGATSLDSASAASSVVLAFLRREHVLSPDATVEKFDHNAASWNGLPGSPGYGHFRWMRRLVGRFARAREGERVLDFGCGAGWVGIEAAQGLARVAVRAFDPSPEMVRIATGNARASGVADFEGRTGFGERPPWPADGEPPFDLVISSGVVSFSPDFEAWMEGLVGTLRPAGRLVIGDLNPRSRGMRRRRRSRPLLPVRELNARGADEVRAWLQARGFRHRETAGYQLTSPVPQAMHFSATRLGGVLNGPLLLANRAMTALDRATGDALAGCFDSWVMRFDAPA